MIVTGKAAPSETSDGETVPLDSLGVSKKSFCPASEVDHLPGYSNIKVSWPRRLNSVFARYCYSSFPGISGPGQLRQLQPPILTNSFSQNFNVQPVAGSLSRGWI